MASKRFIILITVIVFFSLCSTSNISAQDTTVCETEGDSTEDRIGCLDSDGDGWSDPDTNWTITMGADAFPNNSSEHADFDGDGIGDNSDDDIYDGDEYLGLRNGNEREWNDHLDSFIKHDDPESEFSLTYNFPSYFDDIVMSNINVARYFKYKFFV